MPRRSPSIPSRRCGATGFYESGWGILLVLVGAPFGFFVAFYYGVHALFWALARGSSYRTGDLPFLGVLQMTALNLCLPGLGLMAGGFPLQGWACLVLWVMVFSTAVVYAELPTRNLTVVHVFAGLWGSVQAGMEAHRLTREAPTGSPEDRVGRLNPRKQRVPTLEDPDLYPVRLEALQLLLEASIDPNGRLDSIQQAAVNRLRHILRIEDQTFSRLMREISARGRGGETPGLGARLGRTRTFERVLETAVDHPAFETTRDAFLEAAANLLGIPQREARLRLQAYERGEDFQPEESLVDSRMPPDGSR